MNTASQRHRTRHNNLFSRLILIVLFLSVLLSGCAPQATLLPTETPTQVPTDTPQPTSTSTLTSTATATETPTATPTATPDKKATAAAKKTSTAVARLEMVKPELEKIGIDPATGHVVWADPEEIKLEVSTYGEANFYPLDELGDLENFVAQTKVTWESTGGLAGCGFVFRVNEELDNSQYSLEIVRLQGMPGWLLSYSKYGKFEYFLTDEPVYSNNINDTNNSTNIITLVANKDEFNVYLNGKKEQRAFHDRIPRGTFALVTSQESGKTTCRFEDSWIFALDQ